MNPDLRPLRDIHDALGNPWWPLAPGWWLLLALVAGVAGLIWYYRRVRPVLPAIPLLRIGDWRWDAHRELQRLRRAPEQASMKARLAALSELLKRIAMAREGRASCAGLHGQAWLDWLSAQDPDGFDWSRKGQLLTRAPYAPELLDLSGLDRVAGSGPAAATGPDSSSELRLDELFTATERWITTRAKTPERRADGAKVPFGRRSFGRLGSLFGRLMQALRKLATATARRRPPSESTR